MRKDIKGFVNECEKCIKARHTRYYPSKPSTLHRGLLQTVRADLFKFKEKDYLILVDYCRLMWLNLLTKQQSQCQKNERNV